MLGLLNLRMKLITKHTHDIYVHYFYIKTFCEQYILRIITLQTSFSYKNDEDYICYITFLILLHARRLMIFDELIF